MDCERQTTYAIPTIAYLLHFKGSKSAQSPKLPAGFLGCCTFMGVKIPPPKPGGGATLFHPTFVGTAAGVGSGC